MCPGWWLGSLQVQTAHAFFSSSFGMGRQFQDHNSGLTRSARRVVVEVRVDSSPPVPQSRPFLSRLRRAEGGRECPACGTDRVVDRVYGLPDPEKFDFDVEPRGEIALKVKGDVTTFYLTGRKAV